LGGRLTLHSHYNVGNDPSNNRVVTKKWALRLRQAVQSAAIRWRRLSPGMMVYGFCFNVLFFSAALHDGREIRTLCVVLLIILLVL
jgi:hypothetical protein